MFSYFGFLSRPQNQVGDSQKSEPRAAGDDEDDGTAPMFPAVNSIQRCRDSSAPKTNSNPTLNIQSPDQDQDADANNQDDGSDEELPDIHPDHLSLPLSTLKKPTKPRQKVRLMPGFSQLDWAKLKGSGANLRGEEVRSLRGITRSELAHHNTKDDAWSSFNGKVYNITHYLNYHPGGVRELMRVAGKDGTELFMKTHAWISPDSMLDTCLLGFLVNG